MTRRCLKGFIRTWVLFIVGGPLFHAPASATDKLFTIYTARVMSQAYPWIAQETGTFQKIRLGRFARLCNTWRSCCGDDTGRG